VIHLISIIELIVVFIVPTIVVFLFAPSYISSLKSPIDFMFYLAKVRSFVFAIPLFAHRWLLENAPMAVYGGEPMLNKSQLRHIPLYLGSTLDIVGQLSFLLVEYTQVIESLDRYISWGVEIDRLARAR
jgi:hypothetical protein